MIVDFDITDTGRVVRITTILRSRAWGEGKSMYSGKVDNYGGENSYNRYCILATV